MYKLIKTFRNNLEKKCMTTSRIVYVHFWTSYNINPKSCLSMLTLQ